jgi:TonB-dependent receptor
MKPILLLPPNPESHFTTGHFDPARKSTRRILVVLSFALLPLAVGPAQGQSPSGSVEGRVQNSSTGIYLNNARVAIEGTNAETMSNGNGEYRLAGVPPGTVRIRVSYAGLEAQSASVVVAPAATARRDFELALPRAQTTADKDVVQLASFVVEATALSAAAAAVNEQKMAPNIRNVVVLDEIGDLGDGNIGEYLKYTPGISITYGPQTAGSLSIRGMPAGGVVFMRDGAEITAGADRSFDLANSSAGSIDRIEVTKVPTPDLPANAVGGSINIIGRSGFSNPRRALKVNTYGAYNTYDRLQPPGLDERLGSDRYSRERAIQPGFDLSYSQPINKALAFTVNLSSVLRVYDMDYDNPGWDLVRGVLTTSNLQNALQTTERQLAATTFDWKINRENSLRLNLEHVQINTPTRQHILIPTFGAGNTGDAFFTQGAAAGNDSIRQNIAWADRTRGTSSAIVRYVHEGKIYKLDATATFSRFWDQRKNIEHGFFSTIGTTQRTALILRADDLIGVYSRRAPTLSAKDRAGLPVDPYDNAELSIGNPTSNPNFNRSTSKQFAVNLSRNFSTRFPLTIKSGYSVLRQTKDITADNLTWTFTPPGGANGRLVKNLNVTNDLIAGHAFFNDTLKANWVSPGKFYDLFQQHPEYFVLDEAAAYIFNVTNSRWVEETISAGYVRGDLKFLDNKLWLVGGVRFESTADQGAGARNDIRATYRQDASGNLLRDAAGRLIPVSTIPLETAKLRYKSRAVESRKDYQGFYPSLNATYYLTDTLVARAAFARTIGRPSIGEISPALTITDPDSTSANRTITAVNTGLKPWTADNYDLSFEAYGLRGAVASFSLFRKDIKNFFGATRLPATAALLADFGLPDDYLDYEVISKANFGEASVEGYELSWRQSLYFLPPWAKGFSLFGNATISRLSGANAADFTPFAHKNLNWGASYVRQAFTFKFNVAYTYKVTGARVAASAIVPAETFLYVAPQITQDVSVEYRFARRFTVYGGARNFNGDPKRTYRAGPGTPNWTKPQTVQNFGTLVTLGLRSEF